MKTPGFWPLAAALILTVAPAPAREPAPADILGWWHGTSTCVRAEWNAACKDEEILYQFVPAPPDSGHARLHASKIVGGEVVPMGDLEVRHAPDRDTWDGDFANGRVDIRWSYSVKGDTLVGQLVLRPEMRVGRHVVARRGKVSVF